MRNPAFATPLTALACVMIAMQPVPATRDASGIIIRICGSNASYRLPMREDEAPTPGQDHRSLACHMWLRESDTDTDDSED
jgi:hypothetical protein